MVRITKLSFLLLAILVILLGENYFVFALEKPEIFPQLGHSHEIKSVIYSPDGRYIFSGSEDETIKQIQEERLRHLKDTMNGLLGYNQKMCKKTGGVFYNI